PRLITALVVAALATLASIHLFFQAGEPPTPTVALMDLQPGRTDGPPAELAENASPAPDPIIIQLTLDRSASVLRYLEEAGLDPAEAQNWANHFQETANTGIMKEGHALVLYKDPETGDLRDLRYDLNTNITIREHALGAGIIRTSRELIEYDIRRVSVAFQVDRSFRTAAQLNNLPEPIVYTLENAFNDHYQLDELPSGAVVKLIYQEKVARDGSYQLVTGVEAAQIESDNRILSAFAFRDEHGQPRLFDANGQELGQPQTLRFPVKFSYISSGFTFHRYHPILHEYRPHVGVDLAANYGAPVQAVADGRVEYAGWCGELGRCVRLDHAQDMVSIYGHLSQITPGLERGGWVSLGETIGRVGTSGLSTGPHLHFALQREGHYVNPLTESLGVNHQVSPRMRTLFEQFRDNYLAMLSKLPDMGGHFHVGAATSAGTQAAAGEAGTHLTGEQGTRRRSRHHWHSWRTTLAR
ncbi:MAG TPA: M23 family metallopeptidase, partial [Candidatus Binataceae bacterium]|nr:M23 family metallopeptidase [Candidatus Binataceae bacterium]